MVQRQQKARHLRKLTELMVAKIKPPAVGTDASGNACGSTDYYDAILPGLILRVNYGGLKVWRVRYYVKVHKNGKAITEQRLRKLGRYPVLKVQEARDAARPFLADWRKAIKAANASTLAGTFRDTAENFIKRHVDGNGLRSKREIIRCLNKYIYPRWEHRMFTDVTKSDVTALLDQIEDQHGARQADMCLAIVSKLTNWYEARNDGYRSPVGRGMRRSKSNGGRHRILNDDEIRALWTTCGDMGTFGAIVKLLLLTAQRRDKVAAMKWSDIVDGEWRIAIEEREKGNAGTLRLPKLALDIINAQPKLHANPYVFAAGKGNGPFNSFSQRKDELDAKLKLEPWVLHDLRRTARSLMAKAGVADNIAERVMGHAIPGVRGVYDRHSYVDEKADALRKLAGQIDTVLHPAKGNNVVSMTKRKRR